VAPYYRLDGTGLTLRELWRVAPSVPAFLAAVIRQKVLRRPLPDQPAICRAERIDRIPVTTLPPAVRPGFDALAAEFAAHGFALQFLYQSQALGRQAAYAAAFLSDDGQILGTAVVVMNPAAAGPPGWESARTTALDDGRLLTTTTIPQRFDTPPGYVVTRLPARPLADLVVHQRSWLARHRDRVRPFAAGDVEPHLIGVQQRHFDFQVGRGHYVPIAAAEAARLQALWEDDPIEMPDGRDGATNIQAERD
jgi:hypothetical protein